MSRDLVPATPRAMSRDLSTASDGASIWQKAVYILARFTGLIEATGPRGLTIGGESNAGPQVNLPNVLGLSTAWACINLYAGVTGTLPCQVGRKVSATESAPAPDHWLYRLVHDSPNADMTALEFWEFIAACLELRGNAYAEIMRITDDGRPVALHPLNPDAVQPFRNAAGAIRYRVTINGRQSERGPDTIWHIRGFGGDPLGGISTLAIGRQVFGLALAGDEAAAMTFRNGMRPTGAFVFEDSFKGDQRDRAASVMAELYSGAINSGRPLVLDRGQKWQSIQMAPDDAQMLQTRAFSVEEICRMFQTPPVLIGHAAQGQTMWGTGLEQIKLGWHQFSLLRRLERIEQSAMKWLMTPADRAAGYFMEFNAEGFLRGDSRGRSSFYGAGLKDGWLTVNEVRRWENLPPVAGGDVPRVQAQNVPLDQANGPPKLPGSPPAEDAE